MRYVVDVCVGVEYRNIVIDLKVCGDVRRRVAQEWIFPVPMIPYEVITIVDDESSNAEDTRRVRHDEWVDGFIQWGTMQGNELPYVDPAVC